MDQLPCVPFLSMKLSYGAQVLSSQRDDAVSLQESTISLSFAKAKAEKQPFHRSHAHFRHVHLTGHIWANFAAVRISFRGKYWCTFFRRTVREKLSWSSSLVLPVFTPSSMAGRCKRLHFSDFRVPLFTSSLIRKILRSLTPVSSLTFQHVALADLRYLYLKVVHHFLGMYGQSWYDNAWYSCEAGGFMACGRLSSVSGVDKLQLEDTIFDGEVIEWWKPKNQKIWERETEMFSTPQHFYLLI